MLKRLGFCVFRGSILIRLTLIHAAVFAQHFSAVENYAINRPGIVMVKTEYTANVYVKKIHIDEHEFYRMLDAIQRMDTSGITMKRSEV